MDVRVIGLIAYLRVVAPGRHFVIGSRTADAEQPFAGGVVVEDRFRAAVRIDVVMPIEERRDVLMRLHVFFHKQTDIHQAHRRVAGGEHGRAVGSEVIILAPLARRACVKNKMSACARPRDVR